MPLVASPLSRAWDFVVDIPHNFDSEKGIRFFVDYADVLQYACVLYTMLILLGPRAMADRDPFNVKNVIRVWNLLLAVFSILGSISTVTLLLYMTESRSFYDVTCRFDHSVLYDGAFSFWVYSFMVSKIPEMLDTLFLCLSKKPITFLHCYHHLTVTVFSWIAGTYLLPSGIWFAAMNFVVHSIMYSYYCLCSCGLKALVAPVAPLITFLQIAQMLLGYAICLYTGYHKFLSPYGCDANPALIRMGLLMYGSYFALFVLFFARRYGKGKSRHRQHAASRDTSAEASDVKKEAKRH